MKGSYTGFILRQSLAESQRLLRIQKAGVREALAEEAAELKRARIMNRAEPGYERKNGKI